MVCSAIAVRAPMVPSSTQGGAPFNISSTAKKRKGKEGKGKERKEKERKGKERKGKERKEKERKGKERKERKTCAAKAPDVYSTVVPFFSNDFWCHPERRASNRIHFAEETLCGKSTEYTLQNRC